MWPRPAWQGTRHMSVALAYVVVPSAAFWLTLRQVSKRTWRSVLRRLLDSCCQSYEWDDELPEASSSARVRNVVLRPSTVDAALRKLGLCTAGTPCTIARIHVAVQFRLRGDLGLFSQPWTIEIEGVELELRRVADCPDYQPPTREASPQERSCTDDSEVEPSDAEKRGSSWLPIHKAVENLRLHVNDMRIRIQAGHLAFISFTDYPCPLCLPADRLTLTSFRLMVGQLRL